MWMSAVYSPTELNMGPGEGREFRKGSGYNLTQPSPGHWQERWISGNSQSLAKMNIQTQPDHSGTRVSGLSHGIRDIWTGEGSAKRNKASCRDVQIE